MLERSGVVEGERYWSGRLQIAWHGVRCAERKVAGRAGTDASASGLRQVHSTLTLRVLQLTDPEHVFGLQRVFPSFEMNQESSFTQKYLDFGFIMTLKAKVNIGRAGEVEL